MDNLNDLVRTALAKAYMNKDFISVKTYSGYRLFMADPRGVEHLLPPDVSDQDLGSAVLDALARSRFVVPAPRDDVWIHPEATFDMELYDYNLSAQRYKDWIERINTRYGYKTKRALFKDMKLCSIEKKSGLITIMPSRHEKLEGWGGTGKKGSDHIIINDISSPDEVGSSLRTAFDRCL